LNNKITNTMSRDQNNIGQWLLKGLDYWYLFAIIFPAALVAAYLFLQYTPSKYKAEAMLLIKDEEGQFNEELVFSELGLGKKSKNLENEVLVLKSTPLMYEVVQDLELQFQFTEINTIQRTDLYKKSPIKVLDWQPAEENKPLEAVLYQDKPGGFHLELKEGEFSGEYGKEIIMPEGKLTLFKNSEQEIQNPIAIRVNSIWNRANELGKKFEVEVVGEGSSVLHLSIKDVAPERAKDVLTRLIEVYNERTVKKKNSVFENSIKFIDDRVKLIAGELSETESDVQDYKRQYNVVELSTEGNKIQEDLSIFNKQISDSEVQLEILNTIQHFLAKNKENFEFVPTNLSLSNLTLNRLLDQFNEVLTTRDLLENELGASHPELLLNERQLVNLRQTIINNTYAIKKDLQISNKANRELKANLERRLQSLPKRERELIGIERRKDIKEKLYIYLLQKREEAAISLAVTAATGQIVEPPSYSEPVSPKKAQVWLVAAFLGLAIPAGFVFFLDSMNDKIREEEDILEATNVPVVGVLAQTRKKDNLVARENNFSTAAEMFRLLRSNLSHVTQNKNLRTLLITSSIYGEGKSYIALNLAMTQVLTGKRVVIVDLDLRSQKPETYGQNAPARIGVTDYLVNSAMTPRHVIHNSGLHPCLDLINRGSAVSNPNQMVLSLRLRELMDQLKEVYDFIILDAPPVGLVTDTLEMNDLAEATMYVTRSKVTLKSHLKIVENISRMNKLPQPFIVLNGLRISHPAGYVNSFKSQSIVEHKKNGKGLHFQKERSTAND
jgi:tyrosine-protein kinase Etk/Wzc